MFLTHVSLYKFFLNDLLQNFFLGPEGGLVSRGMPLSKRGISRFFFVRGVQFFCINKFFFGIFSPKKPKQIEEFLLSRRDWPPGYTLTPSIPALEKLTSEFQRISFNLMIFLTHILINTIIPAYWLKLMDKNYQKFKLPMKRAQRSRRE